MHRPVRLAVAVFVAAAATVAVPAVDAAAARPCPSSTRTIALPDGFQPEGVTADRRTYFAGSVANGAIVTGDLCSSGAATVLWPGVTGRSLRGLLYVASSNLVWAVGNVGDVAHVWAIDASSGALVTDTVVPGGMFLNDLVVDGDALWVTDSDVERLTRISLDAAGHAVGAPTFLPLGGQWPGAQGGLSANGIRLLNSTHVVLDHSTAGGLWSVDLRTGDAVRIPVVGGPAITGGDGMEKSAAQLWVVRGTSDTSVAKLRLRNTGHGWVARWQTLLTDPSLDVPSDATYTRGSLFAVNARFGNPSPATAAYYLTRLS